jgi:hypothetical protein
LEDVFELFVPGKSLLKEREGRRPLKWLQCDTKRIKFYWEDVSEDGSNTIKSKSLNERLKSVLMSLGLKFKIG